MGQTASVYPSTMAAGAATGTTINMDSRTPAAIEVGSTFTGTTITFQVSSDGTNFAPLYIDTGILYTAVINTTKPSITALDAVTLSPFQYIIPVAGTNQTVRNDVKIHARKY